MLGCLWDNITYRGFLMLESRPAIIAAEIVADRQPAATPAPALAFPTLTPATGNPCHGNRRRNPAAVGYRNGRRRIYYPIP